MVNKGSHIVAWSHYNLIRGRMYSYYTVWRALKPLLLLQANQQFHFPLINLRRVFQSTVLV